MLPQTEGLPSISQETARRNLHEMQFSYKPHRYSLIKLHPPEAFGKAARIIDELDQFAQTGQCELLFFDE